MEDFLDLDVLIKQLALALGLAMVIGNVAAIWKHRRGERPKDEQGSFRPALAAWLISVGLIISLWGGISLLV